MKIAVASDDGKMIAQHFGRTKGFLIYDIEQNAIKSSQYIANTFTHHHHGDHHEQKHNHEHEHAHSHASILEALQSCGTIISRGMGRRLLDDFQNNNKQVYITDEADAASAVQLFLKGELTHLPGKSCSH
ncbi:MAG TPA: NifB/NifX family molybdenum-iron cluster-binding protein [Bacteroidales bacterium]|nr:NifB/NifX family molybdenum-iron cluster-binding protein [Bacteroidales bacterium]HRX95528.1 NifB/NifX family molybdenum-iron cluster-binding protein [Bacteroidales bacterium]